MEIFLVLFPMDSGPGQGHDYRENQGITRDVQIKVSKAVHQDRRDTSDRTEADNVVHTSFEFPTKSDSLRQDPENRAKHQDSPGAPEITHHFQVVTVCVVDSIV